MARIELNDPDQFNLTMARYMAYATAGNYCRHRTFYGWFSLQDKISIGRKLLLSEAKKEVIHLTAVSERIGLEIAALEEELLSKQIING